MASHVSRNNHVSYARSEVTDSMASAQRVDVQEGIGLLTLEELHGRDLACGSGQRHCIAISSAACGVEAYP
jgi:hypothetical protein